MSNIKNKVNLSKFLLAQKTISKVSIVKDAVNPFHKNSYMTLDNLLSVVVPVLNENDLVIVQNPGKTKKGFLNITTQILSKDGDLIVENITPMPIKDNSTAQDVGSLITYGKRYGLTALLGISADLDDDGNSVSVKTNPPKANVSTGKKADSTKAEKTDDDKKPWINEQDIYARKDKIQSFVEQGLSDAEILKKIRSVFNVSKNMASEIEDIITDIKGDAETEKLEKS